MSILPIITEALRLLPAMMDTAPARVALVAIQLQEDPQQQRRQVIMRNGRLERAGPAMGLWQFEQGGGVAGVMRHPETRDLAAWLCRRRRVPFDAGEIWRALERDDVLAAGFARLNLWWLPQPLARVGDEAGAWAQYIEAWRPGKPHLRTWAENYRAAVGAANAPQNPPQT